MDPIRTAPRPSTEYSQPNSPPFGVQELQPWNDLLTYSQQYAKQNPEIAALCCFGIGFVLGWRLKPW